MGKRSVEAATLHPLPALGICFGDVGPRRIPRIEPVLCLEREVVPLATARLVNEQNQYLHAKATVRCFPNSQSRKRTQLL